jgi:hypothetical protein
MQAVIYTGSINVDYPDRSIRRRRDDLDEINQTFQRGVPGLMRPGTGFPGASGFTIVESTETLETPDCYVYDVRGVGAFGDREISRTETPNEEGWDEASVRYLTSNKFFVQLGSAMAGFTGMRCVSVSREQHPQSSSHWYVTGNYRGQFSQKHNKVRWTSNGREMSKDKLINTLTGGWNDPRKSEILWGRQGCTISYVSLFVPTKQVPFQSGGAPHSQVPTVFSPSLSGDPSDLTWHWPNGWTLAGMDCDIIAGTTVCFVTESWVFNNRVTFG